MPIGKQVNQLVTLDETGMSQNDSLIVFNNEDSTTRQMAIADLQKSGLLAGYSFQNSWYYENGRTHDGNPDVIVEAEEGVTYDIDFTTDTEGDFDNLLPVGMPDPYDRSTGLLTLNQFQEQDFIQFRFQVDCTPETDNGTLMLSLEVQRHGRSPFSIDEEMINMDDGAGIEYSGLATIPIFIGSMKDDGTGNPATIRPQVKLINTDGDIKPRGFVMYAWR
jgi:hypothetical protein